MASNGSRSDRRRAGCNRRSLTGPKAVSDTADMVSDISPAKRPLALMSPRAVRSARNRKGCWLLHLIQPMIK
jgi:hypothetical protein